MKKLLLKWLLRRVQRKLADIANNQRAAWGTAEYSEWSKKDAALLERRNGLREKLEELKYR